MLEKAVATSDLSLAFKDSDFNFIISNVQKLSHMNRSQWLQQNVKLSTEIGKAIDGNSKRSSKTVIIGRPTAINALAISKNTPNI